MRDLVGKVAVVTGAASGIGHALAERFAREGMKVVMADVDAPALEKAASALRGIAPEVVAVPTDVSKLAAVEALASKALSAFGEVHVLCNNAGVTKHTGETSWELTDNDWRWLMDVNFGGVLNGVRVFVPIMLRQPGEAHIVNTSSIAGLVVGGGGYGVVKHAVTSLSENLHVELEQRGARIGVSCLCPGLVSTNIVDSERARPRELRNETAETAEHARTRELVATLTKSSGASPASVADVVLAGIREGRFYLCTEDPPPFLSVDERVRARMRNILERRNPEFVMFDPSVVPRH